MCHCVSQAKLKTKGFFHKTKGCSFVSFTKQKVVLLFLSQNKRLLGETIKELRGTYKRRPHTESLYRLRLLKRAGVSTSELLNVYRSNVSSILEYAVQLWQNIAAYLCNSIESIQKRAFKIIRENGRAVLTQS